MIFPGESITLLDLSPLMTLSLEAGGGIIVKALNGPTWPNMGLYPHIYRYPTTNDGWGDRDPYPSSMLYPPIQRDFKTGVDHKVFPYDRHHLRVYPSDALYPRTRLDRDTRRLYPSSNLYPAGNLTPGPVDEYRVSVVLDSINTTDGTISIFVEKADFRSRTAILQRLNWYGVTLDKVLIGCASDTTLPYDLVFEDLEIRGEVSDPDWYDVSRQEGLRNAVGDEGTLWQGATDRDDPDTYTEATDMRKLARYDYARPATPISGTPLGIRWTIPPRLKGIRWDSPFTFESIRMETFLENQ